MRILHHPTSVNMRSVYTQAMTVALIVLLTSSFVFSLPVRNRPNPDNPDDNNINGENGGAAANHVNDAAAANHVNGVAANPLDHVAANHVDQENQAVHEHKKDDKAILNVKEDQLGNPAKPAFHANDINLDMEMAKKIEKLPIDKLKPVDHMDVVKMEQDGHINQEYHKEMFLGSAHDEFKHDRFDEEEDKLKEIVSKADTNSDGVLDKAEMEVWILGNMKQHFMEAEKENDHIFKHLDPDGDGSVTWKEYYIHFLLSRGIEVEEALKSAKNLDEGDGDTAELTLDDKDSLMSYKFKWQDADIEPNDGQLSKSEFMIFRHPEHSKQSLQMMVENVLSSVDTNNDRMISIDEFSALPPGEVEGNEFQEMDKKWQADRRKEFKEIMDINGDGQVTSEELKRYLDPTNPLQAKIEAGSLLGLMDDDKDEKLSMDEIMKHSEIFITSKLANFGANVHDEF